MTFRLSTKGPFSLAQAARWQGTFPGARAGDGFEPSTAPPPPMTGLKVELNFPADGTWQTVGVRIDDDLTGHVTVNPGRLGEDEIKRHVERILSLDVDGRGFTKIQDEVVADLRRRFPGLRPVLFASAYEAAAWALLTHRISMVQGGALRRRLIAELGEHKAFPAPERLATLDPMPGMTIRKVENLRALGEAAAAGDLDVDPLRDMSVEEALTHLKKLPGIGPFSAELILYRGVGVVDLFPRETPRIHRAMAELYDLGPEPPLPQLEAIARGWQPYRGWVAFLLRNAV